MKTLLCTALISGLLMVSSSLVTAQVNASTLSRTTIEPLKPIPFKTAFPQTFTFNGPKTNLFDYPEGSVVYVLNGKEQVDKMEFMRRIKQAESGLAINRIVIGLPDANQKRIIEVDYAVR